MESFQSLKDPQVYNKVSLFGTVHNSFISYCELFIFKFLPNTHLQNSSSHNSFKVFVKLNETFEAGVSIL